MTETFATFAAVGPVAASCNDGCADFSCVSVVVVADFLLRTTGSAKTPVSTGKGSCETGEASQTPDWNLTVSAISAPARKWIESCWMAPFMQVFLGRCLTRFLTS